MKYTIRGKNLEVTAAMQDHIKTVFDKLEKYSQVSPNDIVQMDIEFYKENQVHINCSIDIKGKNNFLKAEVTTDDFYKGVEQASKKMEDQIRRIKDKTYHGNGKKVESFAHAIEEEDNDFIEIDDD
ncbi:ribosome-associated translation inhibitor RaiA [Spiroplasma sp. DGKH1]|uniref:ribosome hibernation-promoting factor, HPF/YfiA family n=1 Tax=Spiroplasma sp. DGKH1 TaxID=3050074 RepID=UPI0034C6D1AB